MPLGVPSSTASAPTTSHLITLGFVPLFYGSGVIEAIEYSTDLGSLHVGSGQLGIVGGSVSAAERSAAYRRVDLFALHRFYASRSANEFVAVEQ
jgi:hypothetical protein